jgi:hypothetical protein
MILRYMQENGAITQWEAFKEIGCSRLAARVKDLKKPGIPSPRSWKPPAIATGRRFPSLNTV